MALKDQVKKNNITATGGLSSKSITGVDVYFAGSTAIIEISFSGGSQFIKVKGLEAEVGGSEAWGSGTKVI